MKIILPIILLFILIGCDSFIGVQDGILLQYHEEWKNLKLFELIKWPSENIGYNFWQDGIRIDYHQSPAETLTAGKGDCDDYAVLVQYLIQTYRTDLHANMIFCWIKAKGTPHYILDVRDAENNLIFYVEPVIGETMTSAKANLNFDLP